MTKSDKESARKTIDVLNLDPEVRKELIHRLLELMKEARELGKSTGWVSESYIKFFDQAIAQAPRKAMHQIVEAAKTAVIEAQPAPRKNARKIRK